MIIVLAKRVVVLPERVVVLPERVVVLAKRVVVLAKRVVVLAEWMVDRIFILNKLILVVASMFYFIFDGRHGVEVRMTDFV